jgi:hypothetical protein
MPPDPSAMDAAIAALLEGDPELTAMCPGGVFYGVAPQDVEDRVIVFVLEEHRGTPMFGGNAFEDFLYSIQAIAPGTAGEPVREANARIGWLLAPDQIFTTLQPAGYAVVHVQAQYDHPVPELDVMNLDARWQLRGGHYQITVQPAVVPAIKGA